MKFQYIYYITLLPTCVFYQYLCIFSHLFVKLMLYPFTSASSVGKLCHFNYHMAPFLKFNNIYVIYATLKDWKFGVRL